MKRETGSGERRGIEDEEEKEDEDDSEQGVRIEDDRRKECEAGRPVVRGQRRTTEGVGYVGFLKSFCDQVNVIFSILD